MGVVKKQAALSSIIGFFGIALGYFNLLYLMPKAMDPEQVGLYRVLVDIALVFLPFAQLGAVQAVTKFFPRLKDDRGFFGFTLVMALIGFGIFLGVFTLFKAQITGLFIDRSPEINQYLDIIIGLLFINLLLSLFEAYSKSTLDIVTPNLARDIVTRLLTTVYISLYLFEIISFPTLLYGLLIITSSALIIILAVLLSKGKFKPSFNFSNLERGKIKEFILFSLFSLLGSSGMLVIGKIDSIMVTSFLGLYENGIYIIAFYIATVIDVPRRYVLQISSPLIAESFANNNIKEVEQLYSKASLNLLLIGSFLFTGIWCNIDSVYSLIPKGELYEGGKYVVLLIGLGKLVDIASGPNGIIISLSKLYKYNILFVIILAGVTIGLNYLLIPDYGIIGAALASAITFLLFNLAKFLFLIATFKLNPLTYKWLYIIGITGLAFIVNYYLPNMGHPIVDILIRSIIITILFAGLSYKLKVSEDMNKVADDIWARIKS